MDRIPYFGGKWQNIIFFESGFVTFLNISKVNLIKKNHKNLMMGNMRTFVTDGAGFIRTRGLCNSKPLQKKTKKQIKN